MSDTVIRVENLGKKYIIGHQKQEPYRSLRDAMANGVKQLSRQLLKPSYGQSTLNQSSEEFWALKDISFEINQGDRVGIIGRNGAGKSTLLKILSRIVEPTTGRIWLKGRVASLLEVGTGFHPELTGRENIYLNGAILGMSKAEIKKKFDDIVGFAEVEKFLDTPVKRYSSGMYVRLAFAVAANLEPEILIVDEVLAVGDIEFQKKCLGKMGEVSREGRTVLFVSHSMGAISSLTDKVFWLNQGTLNLSGDTTKVVTSYLNQGYQQVSVWDASRLNRNPLQILRAEICSDEDLIDVRKGFTIIIDYVVRQVIFGGVVAAIIHALDGTPLISTEDVDTNLELLNKRHPGKYRTSVKIPGDWLNAGIYMLRLVSTIPYQIEFDNIEAFRFEITETGNPKIRAHKQAYFLPYIDWEQKKIDEYKEAEKN
ncbi:polysaccharide ABC transporter ATP-binding protein [Microseira sp. BLCC-F43]|uniref:ABC transporter ATP-binding protein n=1 Tax=Microseira sp. BLCC-F43 TaxID=3153602 RepID=UPI0035B95BC6